LSPWPKDILKEWDQCTADEKKLFIRQVEVFAAYVAYTDHEIGRVIQAVEDMGKLDNTLIIYINGDNGTSAEGGLYGTPNEVAFFNGVAVPVEVQLKRYYDDWGTEKTYNHMSQTLPMILQWDESFDVGSDTLTGVNDADYQPPFTLTAKLNKLTVKLDRPKLSATDIEKFEAAARDNKASE
jgi:hypothetical protein